MSGEIRRALGPGDQNPSLLDHLAKGFETPSLELRKLVEEEDASMGQRDLTGPRWRATSQQARPARGVMGSPEGPLGQERRIAVQAARRAVYPRHLERLVEAERREEAREAPRQERLPGSGRAEEEQAVAAGGHDLEGPLGPRLSPDVPKIHPEGGIGGPRRGGLGGSRENATPIEGFHHRAEIVRDPDVDPGGEARLRAVLAGNDHPTGARRSQAEGSRESAPHGAEPAVEGELADQGERPEAALVQSSCGGQDSDGDRQIQACAALSDPRGGKIDRDATKRDAPADRRDRGSDPGGALSHRRLGKADDVDPRDLGADPDLHLDRDAVDARERGPEDARHSDLPGTPFGGGGTQSNG